MRADLSWFSRFRRAAEPEPEADGVHLGLAIDGSTVVWRTPTRAVGSHLTLLGTTGSGKSILLGHALVRRIAAESSLPAERRSTLVVVDPKADSVEALLTGMAHACPERLADVTYLDPFEVGFPSNFAKLHIASASADTLGLVLGDLVARVSTGVGDLKGMGGVGARQQDLLSGLMRACIACTHPDASPLWALDALRQPGGVVKLAALTTSRRAREALAGANPSAELAASCISRLQTAFAYTEGLERAVSATTCVQPSELLSPGRIVLLNLSQPPAAAMGLLRFQASLWGRLILQGALERRSNDAAPMLTIVLEEVPVYVETLVDLIVTLAQTGRSRGVQLVLVLQALKVIDRISSELLPVILANTAFCAGRLSAPDAEVLVRQLARAPGVEEPASALRARIAGDLTNLRQREFFWFEPRVRRRFVSDTAPIESWQAAAVTHGAALDTLRTAAGHAVPTEPRRTLQDVPAPPRAKSAKNGRNARATTPWD